MQSEHLILPTVNSVGGLHWIKEHPLIQLEIFNELKVFQCSDLVKNAEYLCLMVQNGHIYRCSASSQNINFILKIPVQKPVLVKRCLISLWVTNSLNENTNCVLIK